MKATFVRFLLVGGVNTLVTYVAYLLLLRAVPYVWAYSIAYVAGILIAYVAQTRYVFEVGSSWRTFLRFPLVYAVQYVVGALGIRWMVESGLVPKEIALLVILLVTVPLGFIVSRYVLTARTKQRGAAPATKVADQATRGPK